MNSIRDIICCWLQDIQRHLSEDRFLTGSTGVLPSALAKAVVDEFDYMLGLRDGRVIRFSHARIYEGSQWVELLGDNSGNIEMSDVDHKFPRGLEVRLSDIMWVADAPDGS